MDQFVHSVFGTVPFAHIFRAGLIFPDRWGTLNPNTYD